MSKMNVEKAKQHIQHEYESQDGLDTLFRMSADVAEARIENFLNAIHALESYYANKSMIEKRLVYQLCSINETLKTSIGHWKAEHPKGLDKESCWKIMNGIRKVFSN